MLLFCYLLSIPVFLYPIRRYNTRLLSVPSNSFCSWWFARFRTLGGELGSCALRCWPAAVLPPRCVSPGGRSEHARINNGRQQQNAFGWSAGLGSTPRLSMGGRAVPGPPWPEAKLQAQGDGGNGEAAARAFARVPSAVSFHPRAGALRRPRMGGGDHHRHGGGPLACSASQPNRLDPAALCVRGAWRDADAALQLHHVSRGPRRGRWPPTTAWYAGPAGDLSRGRTNDGVRVKAHWSRVRFIYYYECVPL